MPPNGGKQLLDLYKQVPGDLQRSRERTALDELLKEDSGGQASQMAQRVVNSAMHVRTIIEDMTNRSMLQMGDLDLLQG